MPEATWPVRISSKPSRLNRSGDGLRTSLPNETQWLALPGPHQNRPTLGLSEDFQSPFQSLPPWAAATLLKRQALAPASVGGMNYFLRPIVFEAKAEGGGLSNLCGQLRPRRGGLQIAIGGQAIRR